MTTNNNVNKIKKWAFIDYENIHAEGFKGCRNYERIFVFLGPNSPRINIDKLDLASFLTIDVIRIKTVSNNNVDFHIAFYLAKYDREAAKNIRFDIISKDKGFQPLVNHVKQVHKRNCQCIH